MTDEIQNDAAPSSTEPTGNVAGGASADTQAADTYAHSAADGESAEVVSALQTPPANDAGDSAPGEDFATDAANASGDASQSSAATASHVDGESQTGASLHGNNGQNPVEPQTFEERVEARFLALEGYLMKLPHSIAHAFSQGSAEPEELATRVLAHLFSK